MYFPTLTIKLLAFSVSVSLLAPSLWGCVSRKALQQTALSGSSGKNMQSQPESCSEETRAKDLERATKTFRRFVAGGCVVMSLLGQASAQALSQQASSTYLKQFETTCTSWNEEAEVTLMAAPEISDQLPDHVACKSPNHKRTFEDAGKDVNPARLLLTRIFFATLTGAAQFLPDPGTAIPAKYLHRYLTGIGGKKVISEPALVDGLENIIRKKWALLNANSQQALKTAKFEVNYADYETLRSEIAEKAGQVLADANVASVHHPLFNSLGSAEVRVTFYSGLNEIQSSPSAATVLENLAQIEKAERTSSNPPLGYLVAEINDPYSWPGSGGPGDAEGGYDQWRDGTAAGVKSTEVHAPETKYPGNAFPALLVRMTRLLMGEKGDSARFTDFRVLTAADFPPELIQLGIIPADFVQSNVGLKDSTFRAQIRAGAKDFMMVKHWILTIYR